MPYEKTFAGLLASHLGSKYEVLNSALGSYSLSIYFKKTEFYINKGYKVDQALVFLDILMSLMNFSLNLTIVEIF